MPLLHCVAQSYAWGKLGRESLVAQLKAGADAAFHVDQESPYAELWMGTHPNGPSRVVEDGKPGPLLSEWLESHPEAMGAVSGDLPFLFKVLSVRKALSIQAHPDAALARELHATKPALYKDPNHKPEMTIALTRFEALYGAVQDEASLRAFFRSFVYADMATVAAQLAALRARLETQPAAALSPVDALVLRLHDEYAADIGCFCPYILNYLSLAPGEAMFLGANEPHAYLSGDCVECMACSDNVVRAGLTPKFIDRETLHQMLTYKTGAPAVFAGDKIDDAARLYSPPVPEFQVEAVDVGPRQRYALRTLAAPSVLLVTRGSCDGSGGDASESVALVRGSVFFLPAGQELDLRSGCDGVTVFRASPNESTAPAQH
ncbi:hypothetical protein PybrP1_012654 [[Pythium] brassicae (nom. inval.)]|nr:hypothetical protein PybrP1_012654 [[Pythium] brassicae (nom. inval.)]